MASQADVVRNYQAAASRVRNRVEAYARTAWRSLGSYRDADIDRLVELIVPQILAGQRQIAALNDTYLATLARSAPIGVDLAAVTGAAVRGGAEPADVYRRPAVTVYTALASGVPVAEAIARGGRRLTSLVSTDMQLAARAQQQQTMTAGGFTYYERVLTGAEDCALCAIASTQRYLVGDLMPIHPGCDCDVAPIVADADPGRVINAERLEAVHDSIATEIGQRDRGARDLGLGKTDSAGNPLSDFTDLIVTREHGEYGPTLTWRADQFTGPGDLAA